MKWQSFLIVLATNLAVAFFNKEKIMLVFIVSYISIYPQKMWVYTYFMTSHFEKNGSSPDFQRHATLVSNISLIYLILVHAIFTAGLVQMCAMERNTIVWVLLLNYICTEVRRIASGLVISKAAFGFMDSVYVDGFIFSSLVTIGLSHTLFSFLPAEFKFLESSERSIELSIKVVLFNFVGFLFYQIERQFVGLCQPIDWKPKSAHSCSEYLISVCICLFQVCQFESL